MEAFFGKKFIFIVIFSALLVGVFYAGPQALIWRHLSASNQPYVSVQITHRGDINQAYMPKAREVYDGHFPPVDFHLSDTSGLATIFPALPPLIFSPLFFIDGNPNTALLLADFIFPALIFLAFYFLGLIVTKKKLWALLLGFLGTLTPLAIHLPRAFNGINNFLNIAVKNFYPLVNTSLDKLFLDRIDDPLLTYLVYIPAIIVLFLFWQKPKKSTAIIAAVLIGLLAYTYFHYWVFMMVAVGILFILSLINYKEDKNRLKYFFLFVGVLAITLIPYFVSYFQFTNLSSVNDYIARVGIEEGRFFRLLTPFSVVFDYVFYLILASLVHIFFFKRDKLKAKLYWGFIGAMFVVWNIQLITGFIPVPSHFWRAVSPIILIILFDIAYRISVHIKTKYVVAILIVLMILLGVKKAVNITHFVSPAPRFVNAETFYSYTFNKDITNSWNWINKNLPHEPKIASNSLITSMYQLSYTSARPYLATGFNTLLSNDEMAERFLMVNKLFKVSSKVLSSRLKGGSVEGLECEDKCNPHDIFNRQKGAQHLFYNAFKQDAVEYRYINEGIASQLLLKYDNLKPNWEDIDANYVYFGPWEREFGEGRLFDESNLELIYRNNSVQIYKIAKPE